MKKYKKLRKELDEIDFMLSSFSLKKKQYKKLAKARNKIFKVYFNLRKLNI